LEYEILVFIMYNFGTYTKIFVNGSTLYTEHEFVTNNGLHQSLAKFGFDLQNLSDWEKCDIYLSDKRVIKNIFIYQNKELLCFLSLNDDSSVDRSSYPAFTFILSVSAFQKFSFQANEIVLIALSNRKKRLLLFDRALSEEMTYEDHYAKLPIKNIVYQLNK
jgi:hypothetical protein